MRQTDHPIWVSTIISFCEVTSCFILKIHGHQLPLLCFHLFPRYLPPVSPFASAVKPGFVFALVLWTISWSICGFWVIFILFPPDVCFFFVRAVLPSHWSFICFVISNFVPCLYGMLKSAFVQEKTKHFWCNCKTLYNRWRQRVSAIATIFYYSSEVSLFWLQEETIKKPHVSEKTAKQQQIWPNKLLSAFGGLTVSSRAAESQAAAFCKLISCRVLFPPTNAWFM